MNINSKYESGYELYSYYSLSTIKTRGKLNIQPMIHMSKALPYTKRNKFRFFRCMEERRNQRVKEA